MYVLYPHLASPLHLFKLWICWISTWNIEETMRHLLLLVFFFLSFNLLFWLPWSFFSLNLFWYYNFQVTWWIILNQTKHFTELSVSSYLTINLSCFFRYVVTMFWVIIWIFLAWGCMFVLFSVLLRPFPSHNY